MGKRMKTAMVILLFILYPFIGIDTSQALPDDGLYIFIGSTNVGSVNDISYSPNGSLIGLAANPLPEIINSTSMMIEYTLNGQNGEIRTIDISDDHIITGSEDGSIFLWTVKGEVIDTLDLNDRVINIRFNIDGDRIVVCTSDAQVRLYTIPTFKEQWSYQLDGLDEYFYLSPEWNPDGSSIAVINGQPGINVKILDVDNGQVITTLYDDGFPDSPNLFHLGWSLDGRRLSVLTKYGNYYETSIDVWDIAGNEITNNLFHMPSTCYSVDWMKASGLIITSEFKSGKGLITVWYPDYSEYQIFMYNDEKFVLVVGNPISDSFVGYSRSSEHLFFYSWDDGSSSIIRPNVEILEPEDKSTVGSMVQITGRAWGPNAITEVRVKIEGGLWARAKGTSDWSIILDTSNYDPGSYTISALSYDDSYYSPPDSIIIYIGKKITDDIIEAAFIHPDDYSMISNAVQFEGYYVRNNDLEIPDKLQLSVDDEEWFDIEPDSLWEYTWNLSQYPNGKHIFHVRALDGDRWTNPDSLSLILMNSGPPPPPKAYVYIDYPLEGEKINGTVYVLGRSYFPSGSVTITIKVGDGDWETANGTSHWAYEFNSTEYQNGLMTIYVQGTNNINLTDSSTRSFYIENENPSLNRRPTIIIQSPREKSTMNELKTIQGKANDDYNVTDVYIRIDDGEWISVDGNKNDWTYALNYDVVIGNHTIYAKAYDGQFFSITESINITISEIPTNSTINDIDNSILIEFWPLWFALLLISIMIVIVLIQRRMLRSRLKIREKQRKKKKRRKKR